jgi:glucosamine kinase
MPVVLGADIGGTSTRVVLAGPDGVVHGVGRAGGGNLRSSHPADVAAHLAEALRAAFAAAPGPVDVAAAHLGIAGAGAAGREAAAAVVAEAWRAAGAPEPAVRAVVGDDLEIAFASAARGEDGLLLLAGTGAVACRVAGGRVVARADGLGWLLGDEGSAVWLGLAALRAAAADLDGRGPATALTPAVLGALGLGAAAGRPDDPRQDLVAAAHAVGPAAHGRLAPLVGTAALAGDAVAADLAARAAGALLRTAAAAAGHDPLPPAEVVVAGALLTRAGPVRDAVLPALRAAHGVPVRAAVAPVAGAVARAAAHAGWPVPDLAAVAGAV